MPIAVAPYCTPAAYVSPADAQDVRQFADVFASDAIRSDLSELCVAGVTYPLRRSCRASYIPVAGEFVVEEFSSFVGQGDTLEEAREDWLRSVHASFQELLQKRPFEMSPEDKRVWSILSSNIDVAVYRNQTPIQVCQFGRISKARPYPQQIHWENGDREAISIDQVDVPDFITFKPGQPFEAVVARDPVDFRLLRIVHIQRRSEPTRLAAVEEANLLGSIGSTKTLPEAGWE